MKINREEVSMGFLKIEQETLISFNAAEDMAELYTADPVMIRRMDKIVEKNPEQFKSEVHSRYKEEVYAMNYIFPKRFVSIRTKDVTRTLSEEQRKECGERLREYKQSKHVK